MKRLFAVLVLVACSKTPEPTPEPPAKEAPKPAVSTPSAEKEIAWDAPASWQSMPNPTAMRKATYKVGGDAEMTVSSARGGVDANVKRWAGQFGADATPKMDKRKVNGLDVTVVEIKGAYAGMGGGEAKAGSMLLGAVVDQGDTQEFFKLIGPEKTVSAARPDFEKLVSSLHSK